MSVNSVSNVQLVKAQPINKNEESIGEKIKNVVDVNKNGSIKEEVTIGLSTLAAIALGGILMAKGKGAKAAEVISQTSQKPALQVAETAADTVSTATSKAAQEAASTVSAKAVHEVANEATQQYVQGGNYTQIKKAATCNRSKAEKDIIKDQIAQARTQRLANEKAQRKISTSATLEAKRAQGIINQSSQGMKNATSQIEVQARVANAKEAAQVSQNVAQIKQDIAVTNPTSKNQKAARYFNNQAQQQAVKAGEIEARGAKVQANLAQQATVKAKNIEAMQASPNYETGAQKQVQNAKKTTQNAIKRKASKMSSKPAYQRTLAKYDKAPKEVVQKALNKSTNEAEKAALTDILATL